MNMLRLLEKFKPNKKPLVREITPYRGVDSVPISHPDYYNQLEPNIRDSVLFLNTAGYVTQSSCQGHSFLDFLFKKHIMQWTHGPDIEVRVKKHEVPVFIEHFDNLFVCTSIRRIDKTDKNSVILAIKTRQPIAKFFTNKFLCNQIKKKAQRFIL